MITYDEYKNISIGKLTRITEDEFKQIESLKLTHKEYIDCYKVLTDGWLSNEDLTSNNSFRNRVDIYAKLNIVFCDRFGISGGTWKQLHTKILCG